MRFALTKLQNLDWFYNPWKKKGRSPKLRNKWKGPYTIEKHDNGVKYRICHNMERQNSSLEQDSLLNLYTQMKRSKMRRKQCDNLLAGIISSNETASRKPERARDFIVIAANTRRHVFNRLY